MFILTEDSFPENEPSSLCEYIVQCAIMFMMGASMFPVNVVVVLSALVVARWFECEPQHMRFVVHASFLSVGPCYYAFQFVEQWVAKRR